ncbi:hypothetical protein JHN63_00580 [Streptomyces sp. MBT65]|uniref:hypothetical protein n=1 Tax=Streptomyces sp. MBT65 TaxID=1488395 RepID=UPI00190C32EA|nr:hypothetical protein [Streptomyces sp. MBT65]MBK3572344.1 hypothetical protein [Streptomyces sp. MBT65]
MTPPAPTPRPGDQLASTVCGTRVVVIRAPADVRPQLACGGSPLVPAAEAPPAKPGPAGTTTLIGKRYVDATGTLELLCTASGAGELTCDGAPMTLKAAKPLPASD